MNIKIDEKCVALEKFVDFKPGDSFEYAGEYYMKIVDTDKGLEYNNSCNATKLADGSCYRFIKDELVKRVNAEIYIKD